MRKNIWKRFAGLFLVFAMIIGLMTGCQMDAGETLDAVESAVESVVDGDLELIEEEDETEALQPEEAEEESSEAVEDDEDQAVEEDGISEDGEYTSKDEVALYIYTYGHLPSNYITKSEAQDLGWESRKGNLAEVAPGMSIGGDKFGNREGRLPSVKGRKYFECDIDYVSGTRNAKRIIYSNQGQVYYTEDHYETFTLLYGEE